LTQTDIDNIKPLAGPTTDNGNSMLSNLCMNGYPESRTKLGTLRDIGAVGVPVSDSGKSRLKVTLEQAIQTIRSGGGGGDSDGGGSVNALARRLAGIEVGRQRRIRILIVSCANITDDATNKRMQHLAAYMSGKMIPVNFTPYLGSPYRKCLMAFGDMLLNKIIAPLVGRPLPGVPYDEARVEGEASTYTAQVKALITANGENAAWMGGGYRKPRRKAYPKFRSKSHRRMTRKANRKTRRKHR
jgi:hypothetical protein